MVISEVTLILNKLLENKDITILNLNCNSMDDEVALLIATLLKENNLVELSLEGHNARGFAKIGDWGATVIAEVLTTNTSLATINLTRCGIGNEGANAIIGALRKNTTLTEINLDRNPSIENGLDTIKELINRNKALRTPCPGASPQFIAGQPPEAKVDRSSSR